MSPIVTRTAKISLLEKGIVLENFIQNRVVDVVDIKENILASLKLTDGKRHCALLDARDKNLSITDEAMRYGASRAVTKDRIATAHLTTSLGGQLIGNFFNKFFSPKIKNRLFTNEKQAVAWLRGFSE